MAEISIPKLLSKKLAYNGDLYLSNNKDSVVLHKNDCGQAADQYEGLDWAWNDSGVHRWRGTTAGNIAVAVWSRKSIPDFATGTFNTKQYKNQDYFMLYRKMTSTDVGGSARPELRLSGYKAVKAPLICFDSTEKDFVLVVQKYFGGYYPASIGLLRHGLAPLRKVVL